MKLRHTSAKKANRSFIKAGFQFAKYMKFKGNKPMQDYREDGNITQPKKRVRRRNRTLSSKNK